MSQEQEKRMEQRMSRNGQAGSQAEEAPDHEVETNGKEETAGNPETEAGLVPESRVEEEPPETTEGPEQGERPEESAEETLKFQLEQERQKVDELKQRLLRLHADFDNFRKRAQREKEEFAKYASRSLLEKLLPAIDNLERAMQTSTDNAEALMQGVRMVYRQIMEALEQEGAKPIEAVGRPFDPYYHQAVMRVESEGQEPGIVIEELQKGYILKDKVIRPSMVKVSS